MKEILKSILIKGMAIWIIMLGGFLMILAGVNEVGGSIFQAVGTLDSPLAYIGLGISAIGLALGIVQIGHGIRNSIKK